MDPEQSVLVGAECNRHDPRHRVSRLGHSAAGELVVPQRNVRGTNRAASLPPTEHEGACWAFVKAKLGQFIYGRYPLEERWRVDLVFVMFAAGLVPLAIPGVPYKRLNALYLLAAFSGRWRSSFSPAEISRSRPSTNFVLSGIGAVMVLSSAGRAGSLTPRQWMFLLRSHRCSRVGVARRDVCFRRVLAVPVRIGDSDARMFERVLPGGTFGGRPLPFGRWRRRGGRPSRSGCRRPRHRQSRRSGRP